MMDCFGHLFFTVQKRDARRISEVLSDILEPIRIKQNVNYTKGAGHIYHNSCVSNKLMVTATPVKNSKGECRLLGCGAV
jgi:hypothetical protein